MAKKMLIDATHPEETRVVVVDGSRIEEFDYETVTKVQISGNIYLAKVTRVEPSLQAAFVEYGGTRHGFLAFAEIHPDYYQIPVADREALVAAERAAHEAAARDEESEDRGRRADRRGGRGKNQNGEENSDRRRRGRRRDGGRRRGLSVAPFEADQTLDPSQIAAAQEGQRLDGPSRSALLTMAEANGGFEAFDAAEEEATRLAAETEAETAKSDTGQEAPDLSDVVEIEIHRAPSEEEAADGQSVVVEKIDLSGFAGAAGSEAEDQTESSEQDEPETAQALAEAAGAAHSVSVSQAPDEAKISAGEDEESEPNAETSGDEASSSEASEAEARANDADAEETTDDEIETLGEDDVENEPEMQPRRVRLRDYRIQEVIKRRQIMLVQVVKEERGNKGAALTTYLSLAGRYCVLMPNTARGGGISRKITNAADRKRLKAVTQELDVPDGMGLIVRTAGANRTKAEIKRDFEYLLRQWSAIRELTLSSIAPCLIYEEGSLVKRAIRDLYNKDIDSVLVEGDDAYREAKDYMKMLMPSHAKHVQPFREPTPLFAKHQIENQIGAMMNPTVPLRSGGYLVIGVTEALVAIDVNSGRSTKEGSIEDTALKTNLEAAEEAARQMRLRDLAGLIVIDFIDMEESKNNRAVEKRLKDRLKDDRARIQVGRISGFGLLEMSRQRLRPGLLEATTQPCPHCKGSGLVRSEESMALAILRAIEEEAGRRRSPALRAGAPVSVANYLMNQKRARIAMIEERHSIQVLIEGDPAMVSPDFAVERVKPIEREEPASRAIQLDAVYDDLDPVEEELQDEEITETSSEEENGRTQNGSGAGRKRRRRKSREDEEQAAPVEASEDEEADGDAEHDGETDEAAENGEEPRRRRGRRGGRRRRRRGDDDSEAVQAGDADDQDESLEASEAEDADDASEDALSADEGAVSAPPAETNGDSTQFSAPAEPSSVNESARDDSSNGLEAVSSHDDEEPDPAASASASGSASGSASRPAPEAVGASIERSEPEETAFATPQAEVKEEPQPRRSGWWSLGR